MQSSLHSLPHNSANFLWRAKQKTPSESQEKAQNKLCQAENCYDPPISSYPPSNIHLDPREITHWDTGVNFEFFFQRPNF